MGYVDDSSVDGPIGLAMVSFIALYNVIELNVIIFFIFKRKSGLCFWSFFFATWGIFFHTISYLMWNFSVLKNAVAWVTIAVNRLGFHGHWPLPRSLFTATPYLI
ncbi:hypothetical protein AUP68_10741 [Ilyonectria robusta]